MDKLHLMMVFVAVAEEGSLAKGARRMGLSAPAVSRAMQSLEQALGVQLLARTTRHVRLTSAGQSYLDDVKRILADVTAAEDAAVGINASPRGLLSLTAPVLFGRMHVLPLLCDYLERYPDVDVSAVLQDRVANLLEEGFDVGVRIGELPDSAMRAVRVGQVRRLLCASPAYLDRHGSPAHPHALREHAIVAALGVSPVVEWNFAGDVSVRVKPRLAVTTNDAAIAAAERAVGITRVMSYQVQEQLRDGRLVRLLSAFEPPALPVQVIHREGIRASAKVRSMVDVLVAGLRERLAPLAEAPARATP